MLQREQGQIHAFDEAIEFYTRDFVGRQWLFEEVDSFVSGPDSRHLIIVGPPGIGKTAFLSCLAKRQNWPRWYIRIGNVAGVSGLDPRSFAVSIGMQLLVRYGTDALGWKSRELVIHQDIGVVESGAEVIGLHIDEVLSSPFHTLVADVDTHTKLARGRIIATEINRWVQQTYQMSPEALLQAALLDPAAYLLASQPDERLVILIDALDEAQSYSGEKTITQLIPMPEELPPNVKLIMTSRPGEHLDRFSNSSKLLLTSGEYATSNLADIREFAEQSVERSPLGEFLPAKAKEDLAQRIVGASEGNFLYITLLFEQVRLMVRQGEPLDNLPVLPRGLDELYSSFLVERLKARAPTGWWSRVYDPILGTLMVARNPLSIAQIADFATVEQSEASEAISNLEPFLEVVETLTEPTYRLFHYSFLEFLSNRKRNRRLWINPVAAHARLAQVLYKRLWDTEEVYGLQHFSLHAFEGQQPDLLQDAITPEYVRWKSMLPLSSGMILNDLYYGVETAAGEGNLANAIKYGLVYGHYLQAVRSPATRYSLALQARAGHHEAAVRNVDAFGDDDDKILVYAETARYIHLNTELSVQPWLAEIENLYHEASADILDLTARALATVDLSLAFKAADCISEPDLLFSTTYTEEENPHRWGVYWDAVGEAYAFDPSAAQKAIEMLPEARDRCFCWVRLIISSLESHDYVQVRRMLELIHRQGEIGEKFLEHLGVYLMMHKLHLAPPAEALKTLLMLSDLTPLYLRDEVALRPLLDAIHAQAPEQILTFLSPHRDGILADAIRAWALRRGHCSAEIWNDIQDDTFRTMAEGAQLVLELSDNPKESLKRALKTRSTAGDIEFASGLAAIIGQTNPGVADLVLKNIIDEDFISEGFVGYLYSKKLLQASYQYESELRCELLSKLLDCSVVSSVTLRDQLTVDYGRTLISIIHQQGYAPDFIREFVASLHTNRFARELAYRMLITILPLEVCQQMADRPSAYGLDKDESACFSVSHPDEILLWPEHEGEVLVSLARRLRTADPDRCEKVIELGASIVSSISDSRLRNDPGYELVKEAFLLNPTIVPKVQEVLQIDDFYLRLGLKKAIEELFHAKEAPRVQSLRLLLEAKTAEGDYYNDITFREFYNKRNMRAEELLQALSFTVSTEQAGLPKLDRDWWALVADLLVKLDDATDEWSSYNTVGEIAPYLLRLPGEIPQLALEDPTVRKRLSTYETPELARMAFQSEPSSASGTVVALTEWLSEREDLSGRFQDAIERYCEALGEMLILIDADAMVSLLKGIENLVIPYAHPEQVLSYLAGLEDQELAETAIRFFSNASVSWASSEVDQLLLTLSRLRETEAYQSALSKMTVWAQGACPKRAQHIVSILHELLPNLPEKEQFAILSELREIYPELWQTHWPNLAEASDLLGSRQILTLVTNAPASKPDQDIALLRQAREKEKEDGSNYVRKDIFHALMPIDWDEALETIITMTSDQGDMLVELAEDIMKHKPEDVIEWAERISTTEELPRSSRDRFVRTIAGMLPASDISNLESLVVRLEDADDRVEVLSKLVPHLTGQKLEKVFERMEREARRATSISDQRRTWEIIAKSTLEYDLERATNAFEQVRDSMIEDEPLLFYFAFDRVVALASQFPSPFRRRYLKDLQKLVEPYDFSKGSTGRDYNRVLCFVHLAKAHWPTVKVTAQKLLGFALSEADATKNRHETYGWIFDALHRRDNSSFLKAAEPLIVNHINHLPLAEQTVAFDGYFGKIFDYSFAEPYKKKMKDAIGFEIVALPKEKVPLLMSVMGHLNNYRQGQIIAGLAAEKAAKGISRQDVKQELKTAIELFDRPDYDNKDVYSLYISLADQSELIALIQQVYRPQTALGYILEPILKRSVELSNDPVHHIENLFAALAVSKAYIQEVSDAQQS